MSITIGKFTLETLTTGMYDSPKDIYREYIQNAVDSIDNAIQHGILKKELNCIEIKIDRKNATVSITDNGTGIRVCNASDYLLNIGDSVKINTENRGFRGIGRLAGLAYCDELSFSTSYYGEDQRTIIKFDAKKLRNALYTSENHETLEKVFTDVVSISSEKEVKTKHYFTVTLCGVTDVDEILDKDEIFRYLSQVAPVPFSPKFKWKDIIISKLAYRGLHIGEYNIFLEGEENREQVFKGYADHYIADRIRKEEDVIEDIEERIFLDDNGKPMAILWYAKARYSGTVQNEDIKGIRLRKGNIQLGTRTVLNSVFKDERFNGWLLGELHILSPDLIPNARRDNVEKTHAYYILTNRLRDWTDQISSMIRKISLARNTARANKRISETIETISSTNETIQVEKLPEIQLDEQQEYNDVAHSELLHQLDVILQEKQALTKYKALNIQTGITIEEKKVLETVLDIIQENFVEKADSLVSAIIKGYKSKSGLKS